MENKNELLKELYLRLLAQGPGYGNRVNIEFWDPTSEAIILLEELIEKEKQ